jgi:hypothetical protein
MGLTKSLEAKSNRHYVYVELFDFLR